MSDTFSPPAASPFGTGQPVAHPAPPVPPAAPAPAPVPSVVDDSQRHRDRLLRRRRAIIGLALGLVALVIVDSFLGSVGHGERQRHLVVEFGQPKRTIVPGDALLVLQVPVIGLSEIVSEGTAAAQLRSGPGHVVGTAVPGQKGNIVLVGHHSRAGGPFAQLSTLTRGAEIAVKTRSGLVRKYRVSSVRTVSSSDTSALRRSRSEQLTLYTSSGGLWPDKRVLVVATPAAVAAGTPAPPVPAGLAKLHYAPAAGALDDSSLNVAAIAALVALAVAIAFGGTALLRRYRPATVICVLTPAVAVVVVLLLSVLDVVGPSTW